MFVSDYVLMSYGTGVVMGVPGHDQRDWDFAKKFGLPIVEVVEGGDMHEGGLYAQGRHRHHGQLRLPQRHDRQGGYPRHEEVRRRSRAWGHEKVNYKLRDWVFSRQRYWGEPIPMVNCPKCGWVPLPEEELPLVLPQVESYEPTDDGESPLSKMTDWVNTTCPKCGGAAKRETDTMPQWAGSSWYFLRYMDPHNDEALASHGGAASTGARWTGTTAAWSTPRCTCSTPASGTSSSTTSALSRRRSPTPSARATA